MAIELQGLGQRLGPKGTTGIARLDCSGCESGRQCGISDLYLRHVTVELDDGEPKVTRAESFGTTVFSAPSEQAFIDGEIRSLDSADLELGRVYEPVLVDDLLNEAGERIQRIRQTGQCLVDFALEQNTTKLV